MFSIFWEGSVFLLVFFMGDCFESKSGGVKKESSLCTADFMTLDRHMTFEDRRAFLMVYTPSLQVGKLADEFAAMPRSAPRASKRAKTSTTTATTTAVAADDDSPITEVSFVLFILLIAGRGTLF